MAAHDHSKPEGSGIFLTDDPEAFEAEFFDRIPLVILGFEAEDPFRSERLGE